MIRIRGKKNNENDKKRVEWEEEEKCQEKKERMARRMRKGKPSFIYG